jgi:uncharacterized protein (UPF0332 family)
MKEIPEYAIKELERARESLLAAKILLENDLFADCVSRSYYAVLHSAKTALFMSFGRNHRNAVNTLICVLHFENSPTHHLKRWN